MSPTARSPHIAAVRSRPVTRRPGAVTAIVLLLVALLPGSLAAHPGLVPEPHDLWTTWSLEPGVLLMLAASAGLYARGVRRVWKRAGRGHGVPRWRAWCFLAGWVTLVVALVSPVDGVGAALFSMHMTQHLLLVLIAAPLLCLGHPGFAVLWAFPPRIRRGAALWWRRSRWAPAAWRWLTHPVVALVLHTVALWAWHLPSLYQAALRSETLHALEHASFFSTAMLFWWPLVRPGERSRLAGGAGIGYVFIAGMQSAVLGALITFAPRPWYPMHFGTTRAWGLTPLEDQQLAGLIMWVPANLVYVIAVGVLLVSWLQAMDRRQRAKPRPAWLAIEADQPR